MGRFTAPDPLGDTGGDHDPYEYCVDDPVNAVDPLGLEREASDNGTETGDNFITDWFKRKLIYPFFNDWGESIGKDSDEIHDASDEARKARNEGRIGDAIDIYEGIPDMQREYIYKNAREGYRFYMDKGVKGAKGGKSKK